MVISFFGGGRDPAASTGRNRPTIGQPIRFAMINEVRAYWEALRTGPDLPKRAQIEPRGIEGALEGAFIIERIAPGHARFRLAGMTLVDLMGMEVRGMPLSALFDPAGRAALGTALEQAFSAPAVLDLRLAAERGIGKPELTGRMLILPLRPEAGQAALALGCLATEGEFGRKPRRFHLMTATAEVLNPAGDHAQKVPGMAEAPARFAPAQRPAERHYLRLVRSGD